MKNRKISIHIALLSILILLTGCISEEERQQAEQWRKRAEQNAVEYVKEKYGFEAEVISSEIQKAEDLFGGRLTSKNLVKMQYDGKEFSVLSFGEDEYMDSASDNYQKQEIEEAYKEEVNKLFETEPNAIVIQGGDNNGTQSLNGDDFYDMFFHEYFDGSNLEEVILQDRFFCLAEYVGDVDLDGMFETNKTSIFENRNMCALFVTYDSQENMDKSNISIDDMSDNSVYENALFVSDALMREWEEVIPFEFSVGQCGDFYYLNVGADCSEYNIKAAEDTHDASEWNGHGAIDATAVGDCAYYVEGDSEYRIYIYYPKDKFPKILNKSGSNGVRFASTYISEKTGDVNYRFFHHADDVEQYEVFWGYNANCEDYSFRMLYDAED